MTTRAIIYIAASLNGLFAVLHIVLWQDYLTGIFELIICLLFILEARLLKELNDARATINRLSTRPDPRPDTARESGKSRAENKQEDEA